MHDQEKFRKSVLRDLMITIISMKRMDLSKMFWITTTNFMNLQKATHSQINLGLE